MNKILYIFLVSSFTFGGMQNASAVRAMNADNTDRGNGFSGKKPLGIQKPTPLQDRKDLVKDGEKKANMHKFRNAVVNTHKSNENKENEVIQSPLNAITVPYMTRSMNMKLS